MRRFSKGTFHGVISCDLDGKDIRTEHALNDTNKDYCSLLRYALIYAETGVANRIFFPVYVPPGERPVIGHSITIDESLPENGIDMRPTFNMKWELRYDLMKFVSDNITTLCIVG